MPESEKPPYKGRGGFRGGVKPRKPAEDYRIMSRVPRWLVPIIRDAEKLATIKAYYCPENVSVSTDII